MIPVHYFVKIVLVALMLLLGIALHAGQGNNHKDVQAKPKQDQLKQADQKSETILILPVVLL